MYNRYTQYSRTTIRDLVKGLVVIDKPINKEQAVEAFEHGFTLLKRSNNPNYNLYLINRCGHKQFAQPTHVRRDNVICNTCLLRKEVDVATKVGATYLFAAKGNNRRVIRPCGCVSEMSVGHIQNSKWKVCKTCLRETLENRAVSSGITILKKTIGTKYLIKFNKCGHTKEVFHTGILNENNECKICKEQEYADVAASMGLRLVGKCDPSIYDYEIKRLYELPCGHIKPIRMTHVRDGQRHCEICGTTRFGEPSTVYLIKMKSEQIEFIKLGFTSTPLHIRLNNFGLSSDFTIDVLSTRQFDSALEALHFEKFLHRKYKDFRLPVEQQRKRMWNGFTECYPVKLTQQLLHELGEGVE